MFSFVSSLLRGSSTSTNFEGSLYEQSGSENKLLSPNVEISIQPSGQQHNNILRINHNSNKSVLDETFGVLEFAINEFLHIIRTDGYLEETAFAFQDPKTKRRYLLEVDSAHYSNFEHTLCRALYESKYQTDASSVPQHQLELLLSSNQPVPTPAPSTPVKPTTTTSDQFTTPAKSEITTPAKPTVPTTPALPSLENSAIYGTNFYTCGAILYLYDDKSKEFTFVDNVDVHINSTGDGKSTFSYMLYILKKNTSQLVYSQEITNAMYMHFNAEHHSVIWVYALKNLVYTWSLVFQVEDEELEFKEKFAVALWETNSSMPFAKMKKEDTNYILESYAPDEESMQVEKDDGITEYEMLDFVEEDKTPKPESKEEEEEEEEEVEEEEEEDSEEESEEFKAISSKATNSLLSVGYSTDRSFVVRGAQIGVFKSDGNKLKYCTSIKKLKTKNGDFFSPKKMMLHQQDSSLLLLKPNENNKIFRMDLERGDIVEEWKTHEYHQVNDILPQSKYAQTTNETLLKGINALGVMTIDPRLSSNKVVDSQSYFYKPSSKPGLMCAATTGGGDMVIGSKSGDIRLFNEKSVSAKSTELEKAPKAKTSLPGFGDPIIGIDVTEDGEWILATCETYLLVIPSKTPNGTSGFTKSTGKDKPIPRRLQLKREHIAQMGGKLSFTPAKFNTGPTLERSIVTSSGPYVITWNFRKVRQGKLDEYQIKQYKDIVVADQFKYGDDKSIVVTLPNDVSLATKDIVKN